MEASTANNARVRLLGLGNEILGDDAVGILVARRLQKAPPPGCEVVYTSESGFTLLDYLLNVSRLVVMDAIQTGNAPPGTIYQMREGEVEHVPGDSPHRIGIFETLKLARKLGMPAAEDVIVIAVEVADCFTVGGEMNPAVKAAIPKMEELARDLAEW